MKARVLIVDDSPTVCEQFKTLLGNEGYMTYVAKDGLSALSAVKVHNPDLVLLDVFMPGINGVQVCEALRCDDEYRSLPIVMISGTSNRDLVNRALGVGASDFLVKPIRPDELVAAIDLHLTRATLYRF